MAKPYPQELRDRVLTASDRGMKTRRLAQTFQVSESWVRRIKQRRREHGELSPRPMGGPTVVKIDLERLRQLVAEQPDATIPELHQRLQAACTPSAVGMALTRLGLSFKKNASRRGTGPARRRRGAGRLERGTTGPRWAAADLHRRNLGQDQHDASAGPGPTGGASDR